MGSGKGPFRTLYANSVSLSSTLLVLLMLAHPARAELKPSCEGGPSARRISACSELLARERSPAELARIYRNRAQAFSWSAQYDLAVKDYDAALGIDPKDADALYGRAAVFHNMKKYELALVDADSLIAMGDRAQRFASYQIKCRALAALARFNEAIESCSQQLKPYASEIFLMDRGEVYLSAGQYDRAIDDFDAALKIDTQAAFAKLGRGKAMLAKEEYATALDDFEQANQIVETTTGGPWAVALSKHGLANEALGRRSAAILDFQKALERQPNLEESEEGLKRLGASSVTTGGK